MILRRYRDAAGLPQQQLADYAEVSKGSISALEGGRSVPNVDMLITLARAFGVRPGNGWTPLWTKRKKKCRHGEDGLLGPASSYVAHAASSRNIAHGNGKKQGHHIGLLPDALEHAVEEHTDEAAQHTGAQG